MITKHRPPHIFQENAVYFITGRTYFGFPHLKSNKVKKYFLKKIDQVKSKYGFKLFGWVVLDNHYHLLVEFGIECRMNSATPKKSGIECRMNSATPKKSGIAQFIARKERGLKSATPGSPLAHFIKELHGSTAHFINKERKLKFATPNYLRDFFAGLTPFEQRQWRRLDRRINSASHEREGVAQFIAREDECRMNSATPKKSGIAQFIAREDQCGLKSAVPSVNQLLKLKPPPVWYQYLETVIRTEASFYRHLNYIHQNAVKHGYTDDMGKYHFSSYGYYLKNKEKEWLADCFRKYPIIDFEPEGIAD